MWATKDVVITHACIMAAGYGVGDHRMFVVNIQEAIMIGQAPFRVDCSTSWQLYTKISSRVMRKYVQQLKENIGRNRILERLQWAYQKYKSKRKLQQALNEIDKETEQLMVNAEKKCRRIKSSRIPFALESVIWIKRTQVYWSLLRHHQGQIRNRCNLKRTADAE
jgi:hypothetical protein